MEMLMSLFKLLFRCPLILCETPPSGGGQPVEPSPAAPAEPAVASPDTPPGGDIPANPDEPPEPPVPPEPPAEPDYDENLDKLREERGAKGVILEMERKTEDLTKAHDKIKELEGDIQKNKPLVTAGSQRVVAKEAIGSYREKMEAMDVDQRYIDATIELAGNLSQGFTPEETARIRKNVYGGDLDETINKFKTDPIFKLAIARLEPEFRELATKVHPKYWISVDVMGKYLGELSLKNPVKGKGGPSIIEPPVEPHGSGGGGGSRVGVVTDAEVRKYAESTGTEIPNQAVFEKVKKSMIAERTAEENKKKIDEERNKRSA